MNPTIYIKGDKYAVQYLSETRKDKSLLIVLDAQQPIICDADSTQFQLPDGFRRPYFDEDKHVSNIVSLLESLLQNVNYNSPEYWKVHEMLIHLNAQQYRDYTCGKALEHNAKYIADRLDDYYMAERCNGDRRDDYYCGVTYDVDIRMQQHEDEDNKTYKKCIALLCKTESIAETVEGLMRNKGFCIGGSQNAGNGAKAFSRYVYLYRK